MRQLTPHPAINAFPCDVRILSLANITPYPAVGGIHLRILHILQRIAQHHDVTLGCHTWDYDDRASVDALNTMGLRTVGSMIYTGTRRQRFARGVRGARHGIPPEAAQMQTDELHALVRAGNYDVLHIEETSLTPYLRSMPKGARKSVLTLHNVHFVQDRRIAAIATSPVDRAWKQLNAEWMRHFEPRAASAFDRVIAVSQADRVAIESRASTLTVDVVPNGVDTRDLQPLQPASRNSAPSILFVGSMGYAPCIDAAMWLVRDILPILRTTIPNLEVWVVGRSPTAQVRALANEYVHVTGAVADVAPYYERATVAIVPLRAGGGSRLKILEAMALGRAVVSTTIGAEGLDITPDVDIVLADDAESLARETLRLVRDDNARSRLQQAARATVEAHYDWNDIAAQQLAIYDTLHSTPRPAQSFSRRS